MAGAIILFELTDEVRMPDGLSAPSGAAEDAAKAQGSWAGECRAG